MPVKILMPALSPTMTEGNIAQWTKKEGDQVKAGDVIAEIETDKATMEIEAVDEGILSHILMQEGAQNVAVNSVIAILAEEGDKQSEIDKLIQDVKNVKNGPAPSKNSDSEIEAVLSQTKTLDASRENIEIKTKTESSEISPDQSKFPANKIENTSTKLHNTKIFASPLARSIALTQNIDLNQIEGSGPHGRIVKRDLLNLGLSKPKRNSVISSAIKNNNMRKTIAKRLVESKQNIPHFYLNIEVEMDQLLASRSQINEKYAKNLDETKQKVKISVNDLIIMASAKALRDVPEVNCSWGDMESVKYNNVDIAVAVATDSGGLVTPVVKNADHLSIKEISQQMVDLASRARVGNLLPEEYQGGGFSISNLGMYGIKSFNAIINPPQSAILAVGASTKKVIVGKNDISKVATIMEVCLSCDHRIIDGAIAAQFLNSFKNYLESPILMMID